MPSSLRFHLAHVRMVKINNKVKADVGKDEEQEEHAPLRVVMQTCIVNMEINMAIPQKIGNQSTLRLSYTILGFIPRGHLLKQIFCCSVHNSQKLVST